MKKHHLLYCLLGFAASACSRTDAPPKLNSASETLEFKSLLQASGGTYFERKLPVSLKSSEQIFAAIAYPNGEKKQILGLLGLGLNEGQAKLTSDTLKIYFFEGVSGLPYVAIQVNQNFMAQGATEHAAKGMYKAKTEGKRQGELSEPLIRFSTTNAISPIVGSDIPEGCFDLILYIAPKQPKP